MLPTPRADLKPNTLEYENIPLVAPQGFREYDARWLFEKEINLYCANTSENFSDRLRCGIVIANLPSGPVRDHMLLHVERLGDWASFRVELEQISRVQQFGMFQSTAPMDVGQVDVDAVARGKGGKASEAATSTRSAANTLYQTI